MFAELNLTQVEYIITGLQFRIEFHEDRNKKSRSKFDKEWHKKMVVEHNNTLESVKKLKNEMEDSIIRRNRNVNYSISAH